MTAIRDRYGSSALHLLAVLATLAVAGYAFVEIIARPNAINVLLWFGGAIVAHDLIAFPLYSGLALLAGRGARLEGQRLDVRGAVTLNHVRVPALLSAFALVVWFPLIFGLSSDRYRADTGLSASVYLGRWLLLTAALFVGSAIVYALRLRRRASPARE